MGEKQFDWTGIPIPMELFTKFNRIKFHDDIHKYYVGNKNLISVTTVLHKYQDEFDSNYWSDRKKDELNMTQEEVLAYWKALNIKSQIKGSAVHNYAELLYNNKVYKFDNERVLAQLGQVNIDILAKQGQKTIEEEFKIVKTYVDNFYNDSFGKLIPIKTEFVVFDEEWELSGMMDILFWNVKKQCFQIWDWKTNKELNKESKYNQKLKKVVSHLHDCEFEIYSLQLTTYKRILERNTGIKIDGCYIVWFNEVNENYKVIECNDYSLEINMMMSKEF
jgi:hypothetical protein